MTGTRHAQLVLVAGLLLASTTASAGPAPDAGTGAAGAGVRQAALRSGAVVAPQPVLLPAAASATTTSLPVVPSTLSVAGMPARALAAYRSAAASLAAAQGSCRLPWPLLAGIGFVESGHGSVHGGAVRPDGSVAPPILGPRLDGSGAFALISDTDGGRLDGDRLLDRAVGPMQFIPSTWARHGADGDDDGRADPHDLDDAALAAGRYLCFGGRRLDRPSGLIAAVFSYNHSYDYVRVVLTASARYAGEPLSQWGVHLLPAPVLLPGVATSSAASAGGTDESPASPGAAPLDDAEPAPEPQPSGEPAPGAPAEPPPSDEPEPASEPSPEPEPAPESSEPSEPPPPSPGTSRPGPVPR